MKLANILKIADFNFNDVNLELAKYLQGFVYYNDAVLTEDLYNPMDAQESEHFGKLSKESQAQLKKMVKICSKKDCAYVRLIDKFETEKSLVISNNMN